MKYVASFNSHTDAARRSTPTSKHRMAVDSGKSGLHLIAALFLSAGLISTNALAVDLDNGTTYNTDAGRHFWTFKNPDNNTKRPDVEVHMSSSSSSVGTQQTRFATTGSAIEWDFGEGFNAAGIKFTTSGASMLYDGSTDPAGGFQGYAYLDQVLDTYARIQTGPYRYLVKVGSGGTPGLARQERNRDLFRGGNGGSVDATLTNSTFSLTGRTASNRQTSIFAPDASVLYFNSKGGDGGATDKDWYMHAGRGSAVTVSLEGTQINFANQSAGDSIWSGVTATSIGGAGGMCCALPQKDATTGPYEGDYTLPDPSWTHPNYDSLMVDDGLGSKIYNYGRNGSGGPVKVTLADVVISGSGSNLVGVSAASLGGAREVPTQMAGSGQWQGNWANQNKNTIPDTGYVNYYYDTVAMPYPGSGKEVTVELQGTTINLSGDSHLVGVYAASASQPFYLLTNICSPNGSKDDDDRATCAGFEGDIPRAGLVTVSVDAKSVIKANARIDGAAERDGLSVGVMAMSTGGYTANPMPMHSEPIASTHDVGFGGEVDVTNDGSVTVSGVTAVGLMALSAAGGASTDGASQGSSLFGANAAKVAVKNRGDVVVRGDRTIGVMASSVGSGGLVHNIDLADGQFTNGANESASNRVIYAKYKMSTNSLGGDVQIAETGTEKRLRFTETPPDANGADIEVINAADASILVGNLDGTSSVGYGVIAQSIGSAGGVVLGDGQWVHGSSDGHGGNGGSVTVENHGFLAVAGKFGAGVIAQSIGGGGGAGGSAKGPFVALGGSGGSGGDGGPVTVKFGADAFTSIVGDFTIGALMQSIGGGGGHGGGAKSTGLFVDTAIGGDGGDGGHGGKLQFENNGKRFFTDGQHGHGLVLQTIGGGGGTGGAATSNAVGIVFAAAVAVGGSGGEGGDGGTITTNDRDAQADIHTRDHDSGAIVLQSIGGGGGIGGAASANAVAIGLGTLDPEAAEVPTLDFSFALGATGGTAGNGGDIDYRHAGSILTEGINSVGLLAQSIGGGGGSGGDGTATGGSVGVTETKLNLTMGLGGSAAKGGHGGEIQLDSSGSISTLGSGSVGLLVQSIGGGGGQAGTGNGIDFSYSHTEPAEQAEEAAQAAEKVAEDGVTAEEAAKSTVNTERLTEYLHAPGEIWSSAWTCLKTGLASGFESADTEKACADQPAAPGDEKKPEPDAAKQKAKPKTTTVDLRVNLGASGGSGGDGGYIRSFSGASISTAGTGAHAIQVQSIGGGGGNSNTPGADASGGKINATVSVGADGGAGGVGGDLYVVSTGPISTGLQFDLDDPTQTDPSMFTKPSVTGGEAHGIFVQSIGAGGGAAGTSDPHSSAPTGMIVDLFNLKDNAKKKLAAVEKKAKEKLAQVGEQALADFLGVTVQDLQTLKQDYDKVASLPDTIKQKIEDAKIKLEDSVLNDLGLSQDDVNRWRNAAGTAQFVLNAVSLDKLKGLSDASFTFNPSVTIGGKGGAGGRGGMISIISDGTIKTFGHRSYGILAQSIGGGGGTASTVHGALIDLSADENVTKGSIGFTPQINLGGQGGAGGNGGALDIKANGDVETFGYAAIGIMAQSIGGGGGIGHDGSTFGLSDTLEGDKGKITGVAKLGGSTPNEASYSISSDQGELASGKIQFGNHATDSGAANSGSGGNVTVTGLRQSVFTHGDDATAVFSQSIGGGGGVATLGCSNSGGLSRASACWGNVQTEGQGVPGEFTGAAGTSDVDITLNVGGSGRSGQANGGSVSTLLNDVRIKTHGARSMGVVAQSLGGGGGWVSMPRTRLGEVSMTRANSNGSEAGQINVTLVNASIETLGDGAWGVFAQAVGRGGGFFGDPSSNLTLDTSFISELTLNLANTITQPSANVSLRGSRVSVEGDNAHGIVVQRLINSGGAWQQDDQLRMDTNGALQSVYGNGNNVIVSLDSSTVITSGSSGKGVLIQADRGANAPTVLVSLRNDSGIFARDGVALQIVGGNSSSNVNYQNSIYIGEQSNVTQQSWFDDYLAGYRSPRDNTDAATNRWAIYTAGNRTSVENHGTVYGNVYLEGGEMFNMPTAQFLGSKWVGSYNSLHNYGQIFVAGDGQSGTLEVVGSLKHYAGGEIHMDVSSGDDGVAHDVITVTGLARIEGEIVPQTQSLMPVDHAFIMADTVEGTGVMRDSLVFDWESRMVGNTLVATPTADFTPDGYGLTSNQTAMANYLQAGWDRAEGKKAKIFGYVHEFDQDSFVGYGNTLEELSGRVLNSQAIEMQTRFATGLSESLSCPTITEQGLRLNQTDCAWAKVTGSISEQTANSTNSGYHTTTGGIRLGAQKSLRSQWTAGFSVGYANNYMSADGLSSNGQFFDASLSAKKKIDQWELGGSLGMAYGWLDNTRTPQLFANGAAQSMVKSYDSDARMMMLGLRLRAAYEIEYVSHYVKPYMDVDVMYGSRPGYTESSDGLLALESKNGSEFTFAITPMVEFGSDVAVDGKRRIRAYVSAGASFLPNNQVTTSMKFARVGAPGTFDVVTDGPAVLGRLNIGLQAFESDGFEVRAQYGLQAGDGYWSQSLSANLVWRF